jgi:hypothetical protein
MATVVAEEAVAKKQVATRRMTADRKRGMLVFLKAVLQRGCMHLTVSWPRKKFLWKKYS